MYLNIAVLKERSNERRTALDPISAQKLAEEGAKMTVQSGAWDFERLSGGTFKGIRFTGDLEELASDADIVLSVGLPSRRVIDAMQEGAVLITQESPQDNPAFARQLLERGITSLVFERKPCETDRQALNVSCQLLDVIRSMVKDKILALDCNDRKVSRFIFSHRGRIWRERAYDVLPPLPGRGASNPEALGKFSSAY